jgi:hypothetical protein
VFSRAWTVRRLLVGVLLIGSAPTLIAASDRHDQPDSVALWAALEDAGVTLESGLVACERHGRPVSARFDIADGDLQLIVWIETGDRLFQAAVDPNTAEIVWAEPIKASDDLADATAQKAAMDTAKISLRSAVQQILRDNKDARAVEVTPELKDGHASALVTVLANGKFRKVSIWLD